MYYEIERKDSVSHYYWWNIDTELLSDRINEP